MKELIERAKSKHNKVVENVIMHRSRLEQSIESIKAFVSAASSSSEKAKEYFTNLGLGDIDNITCQNIFPSLYVEDMRNIDRDAYNKDFDKYDSIYQHIVNYKRSLSTALEANLKSYLGE